MAPLFEIRSILRMLVFVLFQLRSLQDDNKYLRNNMCKASKLSWPGDSRARIKIRERASFLAWLPLQKLVGDFFFDFGEGKFCGNFAGFFLDLQKKGSNISGKISEHFS